MLDLQFGSADQFLVPGDELFNDGYLPGRPRLLVMDLNNVSLFDCLCILPCDAVVFSKGSQIL